MRETASFKQADNTSGSVLVSPVIIAALEGPGASGANKKHQSCCSKTQTIRLLIVVETFPVHSSTLVQVDGIQLVALHPHIILRSIDMNVVAII